MVALYDLSIVKAPNVKKKKWLAHGTNKLMVEVQFIFVWCFWQKVVEQIGTELINKGKGKEERNKIHCKERKADAANWISFKRDNSWVSTVKVDRIRS